jgi:hypothetical protein
MRKYLLLGAVTAATLLILAACATPTPVVQERQVQVTVQVPVEVTKLVPVTVEPAGPEAPFAAKWEASAHAAKDTEPFTHWNEATPAEVPVDCAKCHSGTGFVDFIGGDGSPAGAVDKAAPIQDVITCTTCHNDAAENLASVTFPSGTEVTGLGSEARCMTCHQGRSAGTTVDAAVQKVGLTDEDAASDQLGFTNIHYFAAAATLYGTQAKGGYEYPGQAYDVKFAHVAGVDTCGDCHDTHSLEVKVDLCATCHTGVATAEDLKSIRMAGSGEDYDGDGDVSEPIAAEIDGVREKLLSGIQAYASEVNGKAIAYKADGYPYFFIDGNADGQVGDDEATSDNKYNAWTPRLLKAAYNYQLSVKDPGAFAHNGKYVIELLYDSLASLNEKLATPVDMTGMHREDAGHFAASGEPWRHWDEAGAVPAGCAKCHSATGLPEFMANAANVAQPVSAGLACTTCHSDLTTFARYALKDVKFPSGKVLTFGENADANLCISCHQGRESTVSVNNAVKGFKDDEVSDKIRFRNVHYFAAGATLFGADAQGAYLYADQQYLGQFQHGGLGPTDCVSCHNTHALTVQVDTCSQCHKTVKSEADLRGIRIAQVDYDGDGDVAEGLAGEIATMQDALYAGLQKYAAETAGAALVYDPHSHPYFFIDTNANGTPDPDEVNSKNQYVTWTPRLLKAAYNYQYSQKDPGAFAHNGKFLIQVLYDSATDIGADVSTWTRP